MNKASDVLVEEWARVSLTERISLHRQIVVAYCPSNSFDHVFAIRQFLDHVSDRDGLQPRNVNVYEMGVETAGTFRRACTAVLRAGLVTRADTLREITPKFGELPKGACLSKSLHTYFRRRQTSIDPKHLA
jgi:hypothetical protein